MFNLRNRSSFSNLSLILYLEYKQTMAFYMVQNGVTKDEFVTYVCPVLVKMRNLPESRFSSLSVKDFVQFTPSAAAFLSILIILIKTILYFFYV